MVELDGNRRTQWCKVRRKRRNGLEKGKRVGEKVGSWKIEYDDIGNVELMEMKSDKFCFDWLKCGTPLRVK